MKKKMAEQGGPKMDEEMKAKACASGELSKCLASDISDEIKGMRGKELKKVTVASNSPEGLKEGLESALEKEEESEEESEGMESESEESDKPDFSDMKSKIAMLEQQIEDLKKRA